MCLQLTETFNKLKAAKSRVPTSGSQGQIFSTDLLISMGLFMLVVMLALHTLDFAWSQQSKFKQARYLQSRASQIADLLVRTEGYPPDWNATNVTLIGLAQPSHIVANSSLNKLEQVSDQRLRQIWRLGVDTRYYLNLTTGNFNWSRGQSWNESADYVLPQTRFVLINLSHGLKRGTMTFALWE